LQYKRENPYREIAVDILHNFVPGSKIIGLGSGSSVASTLVQLAEISKCEDLEFVPTSIQIKIVAESLGFRFADEGKVPEIDFVFDGADQVDSNFYLIKGGGGALLKEKILIEAARTFVIIADTFKFVRRFGMPVPIEVHPFARMSVISQLERMGLIPKLRLIGKGYPYITENGNVVYDTAFTPNNDLKVMTEKIKAVPGVIEVGLFTKRANRYYSINHDQSCSILTP
jgi:ribose 5-phosphate isomerase A